MPSESIEPLSITPDSYRALRHHRDLADRIMAALNYHPNDVLEIRVTEGRTEIDWLWHGDMETRTTVIERLPNVG